MSDLMLLGMLRMPLPADPRDLDAMTWRQFRARALEAADRIEAESAQGIPADPCVVLWEAMNEAERVGNRSDDKLVVEFLRRAGYAITSIAGLATRSQRMAAAGFTARDRRLPCDECGKLFSVQMLPVHKCEPVLTPTGVNQADVFAHDVPTVPAPEVRLIRKIREVCAETLRVGPGVAVPIPDDVRALAATPSPSQEVMLNGLTETETNATASVAGLSERSQVAPEKQAEIDAEIRAAEELHSHAQQIDEPVFHLRSYGDVSASDLEHYAAKHIQTPKAQQAADWTDVRMELEAAGRDDLSRFVESATEPAQAQAPRAFRIPDQGTPWWQTAKDCGAWTDRQEGDVGYVHFGSTEALRVYTFKISEQARLAETLTVPHPGSEQASKAIDAELEARGWPSNTKNAARAGYEACRKLAGIGASSGGES